MPPPVVDDSQPTAVPGTVTDGDLTTGFVTYPDAQGEQLMGYIAYQADGSPRPAVIVLQEWWGVNDHIKDVTRRFADEGFVALAPDLYHGVVTTEPDEARKLAMELGMGDAVSEIRQAVSYLQTQEYVSNDSGPGIVGFCMGGGLALQSAAAIGSLAAAVIYYGTPLEEADARQVNVPVLSFLGTADRIPINRLEAMHTVFDEEGIENDYRIYDGAQHAFFNDTRSSYDQEAAADAWERTLNWFRRHVVG